MLSVKSRVSTFSKSRVSTDKKETLPFYKTTEWRNLVNKLIGRRGRQCEKCGRRRDEHGNWIRIFPDHIIEIKDGGALLEEDNLILLCGSCHGKKTIKSRMERRRT